MTSGENDVGYDRTEQFASPGGADLDHQRSYARPNQLTLADESGRSTRTETRRTGIA